MAKITMRSGFKFNTQFQTTSDNQSLDIAWQREEKKQFKGWDIKEGLYTRQQWLLHCCYAMRSGCCVAKEGEMLK